MNYRVYNTPKYKKANKMLEEKISERVFQFLAIFGLFIHILWIVFATIYAFFTNDIDMMGYALISAFIFFIALLVLSLAYMHIYFFVMLVYTLLSIIVMLIAECVREFSNVIMRLRDKRKYNDR